MAHLMTFLNNMASWQLRSQFFDSIFYIGVMAGRYTVENYIFPMLLSAIDDLEEYVLGSCLSLFERLLNTDLLGYRECALVSKKIAPLIIHPNFIVSSCARKFFSSVASTAYLDDSQKYYIIGLIIKDYLYHTQPYISPVEYGLEFIPKTTKELYYSTAYNLFKSGIPHYDEYTKSSIEPSGYIVKSKQFIDSKPEFRIKNLHSFIRTSSKNILAVPAKSVVSKSNSGLKISTNNISNVVRSEQGVVNIPEKNSRNIEQNRVSSSVSSYSSYKLEETKKPESQRGRSALTIDSKSNRGIIISPMIGVGTSMTEAIFTPQKMNINSSQNQLQLNNQSKNPESLIGKYTFESENTSEKKCENLDELDNEDNIEIEKMNRVKLSFSHDWSKIGKFDHKHSVVGVLSKRTREIKSLKPIETSLIPKNSTKANVVAFEGILVSSLYENSSIISVIESNEKYRHSGDSGPFTEYFMTGNCDGTVRIWCLNSVLNSVLHKPVATYHQGGNITSAIFISKNKLLSFSDNGSIRSLEITETSPGSPEGLQNPSSAVECVSILVDLDINGFIVFAKPVIRGLETIGILAATTDSMVQYRNLEDLSVLWELKLPESSGRVTNIVVKDNLYSLVSTQRSIVYLVDLRFQIIVKEYSNFNMGEITSMSLVDTKSHVLVGSNQGRVCLLDLSNGIKPHYFVSTDWENISNEFEAEHQSYLSGKRTVTKNEYSPFDQNYNSYQGYDNGMKVVSVEYSNHLVENGHSFLSISQDGILRAWSLISHSCVHLSLGATKNKHKQQLVSTRVVDSISYHCNEMNNSKTENSSSAASFSSRVHDKYFERTGSVSRGEILNKEASRVIKTSDRSASRFGERERGSVGYMFSGKVGSDNSQRLYTGNEGKRVELNKDKLVGGDLVSCFLVIEVGSDTGKMVIITGHKDGTVRVYI
ncbi:Serine/threonine-protein kinase ppk19 [Smittium culicis]|uniref:non-specific serine/threonine protein kinase n=1 Tax=Smittium culicis TaxID=133412 RepID=A0A1R1X241_9FUNG|nr:Serine/threonine-protein kinase ppk19 [Smittium culicis]